MNAEQLYVCENLRTALNSLVTDSDGFPPVVMFDDDDDEGHWVLAQEFQATLTAGICWGIMTELLPEPHSDDERAWRRVAVATWDLIRHAWAGDRDPAVAAEWFAGRAAMPEMAVGR